MRTQVGMARKLGAAGCLVGVTLAGQVAGQVLQNGSFESPAGTADWAGTAWMASGGSTRQYAASRTGDRGLHVGAASAGAMSVHQDVPMSTGTWTFSGWMRIAPGAVPTNIALRLEWKDAATNDVQEASVADLAHLEHNGVWRHIHVTGSCSSSELAFARAGFECGWAAKTGDPATIYLDDVELYSGGYTGVPFILNGGFERGGATDGQWWFGSQWSAVPESYANSRRDWSWISGLWGGVLEGWVDGSHTTVLSQCIYPETTGRWTFTMRMVRQPGFGLSNAQFRIEWRDATYTNRVQADTVSNITVAADEVTYRYEVSGECGDTNLFEIRAVAEFAYGKDANNRSMYLDDARLVPGGFTNTVRMDGAYHASVERDARLELVPGTNGFGPFLQMNYARTTTTFYVLAPHSSVGAYPDSAGVVGMYTAWQPPGRTNWVTLYSGMPKVATITLTTNEPFHGLPTNGTLTLDVYRYEWRQPCDTNTGVPYAGMVKVFYAPYFESYYGATREDQRFLVQIDGDRTNGFSPPQVFFTNQWNKDYFHFNLPHVPRAAFTNEGFESPPPPVSTNVPWGDTGWQGWGDATRDGWSAHSGSLGAYVPGWYTNWTEGGVTYRALNGSAVLQPVSVTGGTRTFATWFRNDPGINPNLLDIRLEWYDAAGRMVQADVKDLTAFPRDGSWHHVFVTGTCLSNDLSYVVPTVAGRFWARTSLPDRAQIDNASFYAGSYTGVHLLANPSFEEGNPHDFRGSRWYSQPEYWASWRSDWGARRGTWCAALNGAETNAEEYSIVVAQNVTPGPGTYTFAAWVLRDTNFVMTNAEVRLEWFDATFTNKVQADTVTNFIAPDDNAWHEYFVTGTCTNPALYEVRSAVLVQFPRSPGSNGATCRIDDGRFFAGEYVPPLLIDWGYHGGVTNVPGHEVVPGGWGRFLKVDYARTATTFFVLADHPTIAPHSNLVGVVGMRVAYWNPLITNWSEVQEAMTNAGIAELGDGAFHGLPVTGTKTVDVFRYRWTQPMSADGVPLTNGTIVYYCPFFRTFSASSQVENLWLLARGEITNNYAESPQQFGDSFYYNDYSYTNQWTPDQDCDRIPDLWELRYYNEIEDCDPAGHSDADDQDNLSEYVADTVPTNTDSVFHDRITAAARAGAWQVRVDAPTTNSRLYDVWWRTNLLLEESWSRCGLDIPGENDGANLWLSVTNSEPVIFFRTGVRLP